MPYLYIPSTFVFQCWSKTMKQRQTSAITIAQANVIALITIAWVIVITLLICDVLAILFVYHCSVCSSNNSIDMQIPNATSSSSIQMCFVEVEGVLSDSAERTSNYAFLPFFWIIPICNDMSLLSIMKLVSNH